MPSCQLIYDILARAENTALERQEQKTRSARAQESPLERQDTRIKYIRSSVDFPLPELTPKSTTRSSSTAPAQALPLERKETRSIAKILPAELLQSNKKLGSCNL